MRIERAGCGLAVAVIAARMRGRAKTLQCVGMRKAADRNRRVRLRNGAGPAGMPLFATRIDAVATTDTT